MSDEIFEDSDKENVQLRSDEINGKQHIFHSLPKEFLTWHTLHYLNDKEGNIDPNSTPESMINANMWKALFNGSIYGFSFFIFSFIFIYFFRDTSNIFLEILYICLFLSVLFFQAVQYSWYAKIRAQGIGESSILHGKSIYNGFYSTSILTYLSLVIGFLFIYFFGQDILTLIFKLLVTWQEIVTVNNLKPDTIDLLIWSFGVDIHNLLASNIYKDLGIQKSIPVLFGIITGVYLLTIYMFEFIAYKTHRKKIINSIREFLFSSGYPIEKAQKTIQEWRKNN